MTEHQMAPLSSQDLNARAVFDLHWPLLAAAFIQSQSPPSVCPSVRPFPLYLRNNAKYFRNVGPLNLWCSASGVARILLRGHIGGLGDGSPQRGPEAEPQKPEITVKNGTENSLKYNTNNKIEIFPP